jgi:FlaG/FlaF family flagellin (archaellin)
MVIKERKAVSNFVAAILLMGLAVAAGIVIYSYTMGYFGNLREPTTVASLSVDSASCDSTTDELTVYVRNLGPGTVDIDKVYIAGGVIDPSDITIDTDPLPEGSVAEVVVDYSGTGFTGSQTYVVKIVGLDNAQISFSIKAN